MKRFLIIAIACTAFAVSTMPVAANDTHHARSGAQKSYLATGEVVAVDKTAGKVRLKHEAVPELKWPAMTMFFQVADKTQLDTLKTGDRVEFEFVSADGGGPLITQIRPLK